MKRLYRVHDDRRLLGICAGIGRYLEVDPVVVRLVWIMITCVTGVVPGIVAYLIAWLVVPDEPRTTVVDARPTESGA